MSSNQVGELQDILDKLEVECDFDWDEDELREFVYDEDIMERWFEAFPQEITKYKPAPPKPKPNPTPPPSPSIEEETPTKEKTDSQETTKSGPLSFFEKPLNFAKEKLGLRKPKEVHQAEL